MLPPSAGESIRRSPRHLTGIVRRITEGRGRQSRAVANQSTMATRAPTATTAATGAATPAKTSRTTSASSAATSTSSARTTMRGRYAGEHPGASVAGRLLAAPFVQTGACDGAHVWASRHQLSQTPAYRAGLGRIAKRRNPRRPSLTGVPGFYGLPLRSERSEVRILSGASRPPGPQAFPERPARCTFEDVSEQRRPRFFLLSAWVGASLATTYVVRFLQAISESLDF